jgi:hypothetical protein
MVSGWPTGRGGACYDTALSVAASILIEVSSTDWEEGKHTNTHAASDEEARQNWNNSMWFDRVELLDETYIQTSSHSFRVCLTSNQNPNCLNQ